jgi:segregation and condensation protein A
MLTNAPTVKTPVFEGPLDLLLELIESRKLLINDISLSQVTDEYISRIEAMGELPLGEASEFVALAATLLLIKSRSLLPTLELSDEETQDIKELQYRLALYQIIKEASRGLNRALGGNPQLFQGEPLEPEPMFLPDRSATVENLRFAMFRLIAEFPTAPSLPKVAVEKAVSLEEMIEKMAGRISSAMRLSFREFSGHGKKEAAKRDIVVSFLALLELVKRGIIRATQTKEHGDIMLEHDTVGTPSYE